MRTGRVALGLGAVVLLAVGAGCGSGTPYSSDLAAIGFETTAVPGGGAGQLYNVVVRIGTEGGAARPDSFAVQSGVLPPGIRLLPDREDLDLDGMPDPDGALTGNARLIGYPREPGAYSFTIKAIASGADASEPALAATQDFAITVGAGRIEIISPTAAEGTTDPAVPAPPSSVAFVNPADPNAFYSFAWQIAGGSGSNVNTVYMPRELELSTFDALKTDTTEDTDEGPTTGDMFEVDFSDGGWFSAQAGSGAVQVGGFQSPRGPVGTVQNLNPEWFQPDSVPRNSRRDLGDAQGLGGGDHMLGTPLPIEFSDYFHDDYEDTHKEANPRAKYPFAADQYHNAFFVPYTEGVDLSPLRFRVIVEAIDTNGTPGDKTDDQIARKAYIVQVAIPAIRIDTLALPPATAGVDYEEFITGSGGVPPLSYELEHVDGFPGDGATANAPGDLAKDTLGLELDRDTGQFFGVPRVEGSVDLTVRVFAAVMNPVQAGPSPVPTGEPFEFDGTLGLTGKKGRHRTLTLDVQPPLPLGLANRTLTGGVDGLPYGGDQLVGFGGVPKLVPDPVGFVGTYPTATAARNYTFSASYVRDESYGADEGTVDPDRELPNALELDGNPLSTQNGAITGVAFDRGFHEVTFAQTDDFLGPASAPDAVNNVTIETALSLSVGPDKAIYLRGVQKSEGNGEPTGLLDATNAMGEARMVPMFLDAGIFEGGTGLIPKLYAPSGMPVAIDILPVMLANGGSDAHVEKSIPSVSGFWPAEANKINKWFYYYYGYSDNSWKHLQQEFTWLQTPTDQHRKVFLWAETKVKRYGSSGTHADSKRYQQFDLNGKRGVMVQNPITGDFWIPAILENDKNDSDGAIFGAEYVLDCVGYSPTNSNFGYVYAGYERYYHYASHMRGTREARLQGLGSYLESYAQAYNGRMPQGRTAVSVAMSADGTWAATALPGGDTQMFLLWRTDKQPIPAGILAQPYVTPLNGRDANGDTLQNSACIVRLGGQSAGGEFISSNPRYLLPDSLMFVRDGLVFLMERHLDHVFGFSLVDGHLSSRNVNSRTTPNGFGRTANSIDGQYIPDQDILRAQSGFLASGAQFSFAGNRPAEGEEGPDKLAFVAGDNYRLFSFNDYSSTYTNLSSDFSGNMRRGYSQAGNYPKSLLFLETATGPDGLDLDSSTLKDLTGSDSRIYGDLLTPGRSGEELDCLAVSPDGEYVAVVRDYHHSGFYSSSYYGRAPTWGTTTTSTTTSTSYYRTADDILLFSTTGKDLDSGTGGTQSVLFVGTGTNSSSFSGTPSANSATYASAAPWVNASGRRINSVMFSDDSRTLLFRYAGDNSYNPKYWGGSIQYGINGVSTGSPTQSSVYQTLAAQISIRMHFRTSSDGPINFRNSSAASNFMKNNLQGLSGSGISSLGDTSAPFTSARSTSQQQFWATFKSENGKFLYMVIDQVSGRNYLVGFNISDTTINGHDPFEPFSPHSSSVGFEQFDVNSFNYECRFAAVPGGVTAPSTGRDGAGIVFVIGSDASAGATNAVDLEAYVFDANAGGDLIPLTSDVTDGSNNAINHLSVSADGNLLVGQRSKATSSNSSRAALNSDSDLFVVTNVHDVLDGAVPNAFVLSEGMSHGATVAFVGEGFGPQALFFSSAPKGTDNKTWAERTLKVALLQPGAVAGVVDSVKSHYVVLSGARTTDDSPTTAD